MFQRLFPGDHPQVAESLRSYAIVIEALGAPESEQYFKDALAMSRRIAPGDSTQVAGALRLLAASLMKRSDLAGAQPLLEEALDMLRRLSPGTNSTIEQT